MPPSRCNTGMDRTANHSYSQWRINLLDFCPPTKQHCRRCVTQRRDHCVFYNTSSPTSLEAVSPKLTRKSTTRNRTRDRALTGTRSMDGIAQPSWHRYSARGTLLKLNPSLKSNGFESACPRVLRTQATACDNLALHTGGSPAGCAKLSEGGV